MCVCVFSVLLSYSNVSKKRLTLFFISELPHISAHPCTHFTRAKCVCGKLSISIRIRFHRESLLPETFYHGCARALQSTLGCAGGAFLSEGAQSYAEAWRVSFCTTISCSIACSRPACPCTAIPPDRCPIGSHSYPGLQWLQRRIRSRGTHHVKR